MAQTLDGRVRLCSRLVEESKRKREAIYEARPSVLTAGDLFVDTHVKPALSGRKDVPVDRRFRICGRGRKEEIVHAQAGASGVN